MTPALRECLPSPTPGLSFPSCRDGRQVTLAIGARHLGVPPPQCSRPSQPPSPHTGPTLLLRRPQRGPPSRITPGTGLLREWDGVRVGRAWPSPSWHARQPRASVPRGCSRRRGARTARGPGRLGPVGGNMRLSSPCTDRPRWRPQGRPALSGVPDAVGPGARQEEMGVGDGERRQGEDQARAEEQHPTTPHGLPHTAHTEGLLSVVQRKQVPLREGRGSPRSPRQPRGPDSKASSCSPSCQWVTHLASTPTPHPQAQGYKSSSPEPRLQAGWPPGHLTGNSAPNPISAWGCQQGMSRRRDPASQHPAHLRQSQRVCPRSPQFPPTRVTGPGGRGAVGRASASGCKKDPAFRAHGSSSQTRRPQGWSPRGQSEPGVQKTPRGGLRGDREHGTAQPAREHGSRDD